MAQQRTSSIPVVKAAIVAGFTTTLATAGQSGGQLPVQYGESNEPLDEEVVVADTVNLEEQDWTALGTRRRDEKYVLGVYVDTAGQPSQQESTERAFAIFALLETYMRTNVSAGIQQGAAALAGNGFEYLLLEISQLSLGEAPQADGRGFTARVAFGIRATVRI